jgi:uncharacterized protein
MTVLSAEAKTLIADVHPAFIATADKQGKPNVSAKGSFRVHDDEHVLFADVNSPRTIANLEENPQVSGIVLDPATRHGCRVWGRAQVFASGDLFEGVNRALAARNMQAKHVVLIAVDEYVTF